MSFDALGWQSFAPETCLSEWIDHAIPFARKAAQDTSQHGEWLRCGGTWFVGVDALPNDTVGRIGKGPALGGSALNFAADREGFLPLHRAQVSVIYPGYPKPMFGESDAAFRFRRNRDAAHVDGLLPVGSQKHRYLKEPHAYVLGIPLNASAASPMVIWEGSHNIMRDAFVGVLAEVDPADWQTIDLTDTYQAARRRCFETCARREISVPLGGSYLIHRLALHGVAPWKDTDTAPEQGRVIAYFRPKLSDIENWLN